MLQLFKNMIPLENDLILYRGLIKDNLDTYIQLGIL